MPLAANVLQGNNFITCYLKYCRGSCILFTVNREEEMKITMETIKSNFFLHYTKSPAITLYGEWSQEDQGYWFLERIFNSTPSNSNMPEPVYCGSSFLPFLECKQEIEGFNY